MTMRLASRGRGSKGLAFATMFLVASVLGCTTTAVVGEVDGGASTSDAGPSLSDGGQPPAGSACDILACNPARGILDCPYAANCCSPLTCSAEGCCVCQEPKKKGLGESCQFDCDCASGLCGLESRSCCDGLRNRDSDQSCSTDCDCFSMKCQQGFCF